MRGVKIAILVLATLSSSQLLAAERYYIPGMGWGRFDDGVTYEQAIEIVCHDPRTPTRFPEVPCRQVSTADKVPEKVADAPQTPLTGGMWDAPIRDNDFFPLQIMIGLALIGILWMVASFSSRRIDRRREKFGSSASGGSKWNYESLIFLIPLLVFWRRKALCWGWEKVISFLIWTFTSSLLSKFLINKAFPTLDGFGLYASWALLYGLLAVVFCVAESKFPDALPITSVPREFAGNTNADPFEIAGGEVLSGNVKAGLWARALVEGGDSESATRSAYVRLRVADLKGEAVL